MSGLRMIDDGYRPGACNIGPEEIERRRRSGMAALAVGALLAIGLVMLGAPPAARWLVALPVAGGAAGILQARLRFCAAYGFRGVRGMVGLGKADVVGDPAARAADRRRALEIGGASALIGLAVAAILVALPA